MGSNHYGVLGLGQDDQTLKSVTQPMLVQSLQSIVQISSGRAHSLALNARREIYGWGRSDNGAIGIRISNHQQSQPMPIGLGLEKYD